MVDPATPPRGPWRRFVALPNESLPKALAVVGLVCFACSLLVSSSAVLLRPYPQRNRAEERAAMLREILGDVPGLEDLAGELGAIRVETRRVELKSGTFVDDDGDPDAFDARAAALDPAQSHALPPARDLAGLGRVANEAVVQLVVEGDRLELVVLPVHGSGFVSNLYGYLALDGDLNTVRSLMFYEHAETPGLGSQIEDPRWLATWRGKLVRDAEGRMRLRVAPGVVTPGAPGAAHEVDGLTGATYTAESVTNLLQFWLGDDGFGPLLRQLEARGDGGDGR